MVRSPRGSTRCSITFAHTMTDVSRTASGMGTHSLLSRSHSIQVPNGSRRRDPRAPSREVDAGNLEARVQRREPLTTTAAHIDDASASETLRQIRGKRIDVGWLCAPSPLCAMSAQGG